MTNTSLQEDRFFFQMYGLNAQPPAALNAALKEAIETMHRSIYSASTGELTKAEFDVLNETGVDVEEHPELADPLLEYATDFAAILRTSLSTTEAAKRLRVHPVRIRQMISEKILYAVQINGRWCIPEFQFQENQLVPNIGVVNAVIDRELDAVSILHWYTLPDSDLETTKGEVLSPLGWLTRGLHPESVVKLARHL